MTLRNTLECGRPLNDGMEKALVRLNVRERVDTVIIRVFAPIVVMTPIGVMAPGCDKYAREK